MCVGGAVQPGAFRPAGLPGRPGGTGGTSSPGLDRPTIQTGLGINQARFMLRAAVGPVGPTGPIRVSKH
ncbi:hypothetical protein SLEP1_g58188 [Rubroshorea leprosula]|uniref:Uncharacterized protein n=1 Tax=Rubroshorea leprosula TaxID=152421 RepID=A0AAV5MNY3_9ROSI|nr:hypothetical protein SLEP1_g58188 [Rubroshorea leprosula]